ncbi:MAG TPA: hypothetical protein VMZ30_12510 [Pyrinomonadaceae bacterium]|nr:hypothetical protein [Pyrinomonadaceae bacterium]
MAAEGRSCKLEARIVTGTNVRLQWYKLQNYGGGSFGTNAIPKATNLTLAFRSLRPFDTATYQLEATNHTGRVYKNFSLVCLQSPNTGYGLGGWTGSAGDAFKLYPPDSRGIDRLQWARDGVVITNLAPSLETDWILNQQTEGTYAYIATNAAGEILTGPNMLVRSRPVREVGAKFRGIRDLAWSSFQPGIVFSDVAMSVDGTLNVFSGQTAYRWTNGVLQTIFPTPASAPGFEGNNWSVREGTAEFDGGIDVLVEGEPGGIYGMRRSVIRQTESGVTVIAERGQLFDSGVTVGTIQGLVRAGTKTAFWVIGQHESAEPPIYCIEVYNGGRCEEWFNATVDWPEGFGGLYPLGENSGGLGFDGQTAVFAAREPFSHLCGVFSVDAQKKVSVIARDGDQIPGTTNTFAKFYQDGFSVKDGKILFRAQAWQNFMPSYLIEYDPNRSEKLKVIAKEGDSIEDSYSISRLSPNFSYQSDDSIIFEATAGRFRSDTYFGEGIPGQMALRTIVRWREGKLTSELDGRQKIGGQEVGDVELLAVGGTNFFVGTYAGFYTSGSGAERPTDARLKMESASEGLRFSWDGNGTLQESTDLIRWQGVLANPGVLTNNYSQSPRYFRVFYP